MILIFVLSSVPGSTLSHFEFPLAHEIAHIVLYASLYFLAYLALRHQNRISFLSTYRITGAFIIVAVYGASDEFHQSFTPGRSPEFKDFLIDVAAAAVILLFVSIAERNAVRQER